MDIQYKLEEWWTPEKISGRAKDVGNTKDNLPCY